MRGDVAASGAASLAPHSGGDGHFAGLSISSHRRRACTRSLYAVAKACAQRARVVGFRRPPPTGRSTCLKVEMRLTLRRPDSPVAAISRSKSGLYACCRSVCNSPPESRSTSSGRQPSQVCTRRSREAAEGEEKGTEQPPEPHTAEEPRPVVRVEVKEHWELRRLAAAAQEAQRGDEVTALDRIRRGRRRAHEKAVELEDLERAIVSEARTRQRAGGGQGYKRSLKLIRVDISQELASSITKEARQDTGVYLSQPARRRDKALSHTVIPPAGQRLRAGVGHQKEIATSPSYDKTSRVSNDGMTSATAVSLGARGAAWK